MPTMRDLMTMTTLNEARTPKAPKVAPVDTTTLGSEIQALARTLRREPFGVSYDREYANTMIEKAKRRNEELSRDPENGETSSSEILSDITQSHWNKLRLNLGFFQVRGEASEAHDGYQERAADRHGHSDDLGSYIESSAFLSGLTAQEHLAEQLDTMDCPCDPSTAKRMVEGIKSFMGTFEDALHQRDGGEEPVLLEGTFQGLASLIPLLVMLYPGELAA